jgi:L-arabonate dehydrase
MSDQPPGRRSRAWFGKDDKDGFIHRSWLRNQGWPDHLFDGRPVVGICSTWSELVPCNAHLRDLADYVRRGILERGGFPLEFPVMSLGEALMRPTTMMYRNLVSMEVESTLRGYPLDGVVLLVGCDKTTPALLMGAASCDLPTIVVSGGPMLNGYHRGRRIGSGTDVWRLSEEVRAGTLSPAGLREAEAAMSRSAGHCMAIGTASTMAAMVEALGIGLPGNAATPAVDARRRTLAWEAGRRAVEIVLDDLRLSQILTPAAFANAVRVNAAIGGSTNAVLHLIAVAGRLGIPFDLDDWDRLGRNIPCLLDVMPSGKYLMEDFFNAGGLPALMRRLLAMGMLDGAVPTINGRTLAENVADAECWNDDVIRDARAPLSEAGGIAVLRGNLAPDGAVIKPSAATPRLMRHTGRAVVFDDIDDYHGRIDDPELDVTPDDVLVLRNCGPRGYPGMAEVGNMGLPRKLLRQGVTDMVRISDARMSGTAYGTVVLHVAPEAAADGPLALLRNGDPVTLDVPGRRLEMAVDEAELARRRATPLSRPARPARGYEQLYVDHVLQADRGVDFDFLVGSSGAEVPRESH